MPRKDPSYKCWSCGELFDEPAERPPKAAGGGPRGLAQRLLEADPSEVTADE